MSPDGQHRYKKLSLIGSGTFGKVYKVQEVIGEQVYVMKRINLCNANDEERTKALQEVDLLASLRHPHIVPYCDHFFDEMEQDLCLVMAHCERGDLYKLIERTKKRGKRFSEDVIWRWIVQLLLALHYMHNKKILHRDIKSQNIFLTTTKVVMLGDFGLSKRLADTFDMAKTPIGTPFYMAPEVMEGKPYSFKGDVWALGCVLYELCTLKAAFGATCFPRVALKVLRGNFEPIDSSYSQELRNFVQSMLDKQAARRPSVLQLINHPQVKMRLHEYIAEVENNPEGWGTWKTQLPLLTQGVLLASKLNIAEPVNEQVAQQDLEEDIAEWYFKEVEAKQLLECEAVADNDASAQSNAPDEIACHREPSAVEEDVSPLMDTVKDFMGDTFRSVLGPAASVGAPPRDARPAAPPRGKTLLEKFASGELDEDATPEMDTVPESAKSTAGLESLDLCMQSINSAEFELLSGQHGDDGARPASVFSNTFEHEDEVMLGMTATAEGGLFREQLRSIARAEMSSADSTSVPDDGQRISRQSTDAGSSFASACTIQEPVFSTSSGQMRQRRDRLRAKCEQALEDKFDIVYMFLKDRSTLSTDAIEDDFILKIEMEHLLHEDQLEYWPLMDELIFLEDTLTV